MGACSQSMRPALFLRNSSCFLGVSDECEAETTGAALKVFDNPTLIAFLIVSGDGLGARQADAKCAIKEDSEFACRGRHRLGFASTRGKPSIEGTQCCLGFANVDC